MMTEQTGIPKSVQIFTSVLICAGLFFFYVYSFHPSISFPKATLDSYSAILGFESTGVRILGSVIALAVSLYFNKPHWLFITLLSRVFIELGDVVVGLQLDGVTMNTFALIALATAEIWAMLKLWKVIK